MGPSGDGVIVTQVVPHFKAPLPLVNDYRLAFKAFAPSQPFSFSSLEGYIAARILCRALKHISGPLNREGVIDALEQLGDFDIGLGEQLRLNSREHQACHRVWPSILRGGEVVPFQWSELKRP